MSVANTPASLSHSGSTQSHSGSTQLSEAIEQPLLSFRGALRRTKLAESLLVCTFAIGIGFCAVAASDRFTDTSRWLRCIALFSALTSCAAVFGWMLYRWIWRTRSRADIARHLRPYFPRLSEQVLSVVELVGTAPTKRGSVSLVAAAAKQVEKRIASVNLAQGVPQAGVRAWFIAAMIPLALISLLSISFPALAWNAWVRFSQPWTSTTRFTFTKFVALPETSIVALAEPFELTILVDPVSQVIPSIAYAALRDGDLKAERLNDMDEGIAYTFQVPGQTEPFDLWIRCGDAVAKTRIVPMPRPELMSIVGHVQLPRYLQYSSGVELDLRSGAASVLQGSSISIDAESTRPLRSAKWKGESILIQDGRIHIPEIQIAAPEQFSLSWQSVDGLHAAEAMSLRLRTNPDRSPTVACSSLPHVPVWLATETLRFDVSAEDDFGLKHIGLEWSSIPTANKDKDVVKGERIVVVGSSQSKRLSGSASISCSMEKIPPQLLQIRAFTEDWLPNRERVYSVPYLVQMMSPEEHAEWVSQQLRRWRSRVDAVYDEELRLLDENRELRGLPPTELQSQTNQERLAKQAADERANSQKLANAVDEGKRLLEDALRNEEIRSQQIESWARGLDRLNQIAENRMPAVADQLLRASDQIVTDKMTNGSGGPSLNSLEKSNNGNKADDSASQNSSSRLSIPDTVLGPGSVPGSKPSTESEGNKVSNRSNQSLNQAVRDQTSMIDEFRKAREQFDELLGDFENSTFVKRFKAASRLQKEIANKVNKIIGRSFGKQPDKIPNSSSDELTSIRVDLDRANQSLRTLQADLEAFQSESPSKSREAVLKEMQERSVLVKLGEMSERLTRNLRGDVLHRTELWADTFDRWAEELAGPSKPGGGGGGDEKDSLPPALLLEIMRIIGDEIDLREETRTMGQLVSKDSTSPINQTDFEERATGLAVRQMEIQERTLNVTQDIRALPNSAKNFDKELSKLRNGIEAMDEASSWLTDLDVSQRTIAAESAAIEALIETKRGSSGGNGSGSGNGGGSQVSGTTRRSPMDLVGPSNDTNAKILPRQVGEGVGKTGKQLPEEFREGLDTLFNELSKLKKAADLNVPNTPH